MEIIVAVVVTFNRLNRLKECIEGLKNQTHKLNLIIVVNNGSTDSTSEWLNYQKDLLIIDQDNIGGAGGFSKGIEIALLHNPDWVWIMDDDVFPNKYCLEILLHNTSIFKDGVLFATKKKGIDGKIQITHNGLFDKNKGQIPIPEIKLKDYKPLLIDYTSFVGPLIKADIIRKIGLPRADFFIWHDDLEYTLRIGKIGKMYLCPKAEMLHYDFKDINRRKFFFWMPNLSSINIFWKELYGFRNQLTVMRDYGNFGTVLTFYHFFKRVTRILLLEDNKILRIKWLTIFFIQILSKKFVNITPIEWNKIVSDRAK